MKIMNGSEIFVLKSMSSLKIVDLAKAMIRDFGQKYGKSSSDLNIKYNKALRKRGLFKATGKCYPSLALTDEDIEITKNAVKETVLNLI